MSVGPGTAVMENKGIGNRGPNLFPLLQSSGREKKQNWVFGEERLWVIQPIKWKCKHERKLGNYSVEI